MPKNICVAVAIAILFAAQATSTLGQDVKDRQVEQYECKDILRDSGGNRDVAVAFLHGFLLGKSEGSKFNLDVLHTQTSAFIERCLENPHEKAMDAMLAVKK